MLTFTLAVLLATGPTLDIETHGRGTISGTVLYAGKSPARATVNITTDRKFCGASRADDSLVIGSVGGVKNVVVYLSGERSGAPIATPRELVLNQISCRYEPRIAVVPVGTELFFKSSDPVLHNVHSYRDGTTTFNVAVPPSSGAGIHRKLTAAGGMKVRCDVHAFMRAAIFVTATPYYAITDDEGRFTISGVPAGTYTINTWHEVAGPLSQRISVYDGATIAWNVSIH